MTRLSIAVVPLEDEHDRSSFSSGSDPLDRYFSQQVSQDVRRRVTACFVALDTAGTVVGYYTLAAASVGLTDLPAAVSRRLPRYPTVPTVRLGRLAVDARHHGQGLGSLLLADALERVVAAEIAAFALIVDAKDARAAQFYKHHGFLEFRGSPLLLFLPIETARRAMGLV